MISWTVFYNIFEAVGCGAMVFIGIYLLFNSWLEPRLWIRVPEIVFSFVSAFFLAMDSLDLRP